MSRVLDSNTIDQPALSRARGLEQVNLIDQLLDEQASMTAVERFRNMNRLRRIYWNDPTGI